MGGGLCSPPLICTSWKQLGLSHATHAERAPTQAVPIAHSEGFGGTRREPGMGAEHRHKPSSSRISSRYSALGMGR